MRPPFVASESAASTFVTCGLSGRAGTPVGVDMLAREQLAGRLAP